MCTGEVRNQLPIGGSSVFDWYGLTILVRPEQTELVFAPMLTNLCRRTQQFNLRIVGKSTEAELVCAVGRETAIRRRPGTSEPSKFEQMT